LPDCAHGALPLDHQITRSLTLDPNVAKFGSAIGPCPWICRVLGPRRGLSPRAGHQLGHHRKLGHYAALRSRGAVCRSVWTGSWTGAQDNPSAASAVGAMIRVISAASAHDARGRTSCKRQVSGSNPLTGSQFSRGVGLASTLVRGTNVPDRDYPAVVPRVAKGHIEQPPSGSFQVSVYAGTHSLTGARSASSQRSRPSSRRTSNSEGC
jgi:hypothetical protein